MTESFEKEFSVLRELGKETFVLRGSTVIVEILPDEELKTKGGLIIAVDPEQMKGNSVIQHKLQVGRVLMCGEGYWDEETNRFEKLDIEPGAIVILPQFSTQFISMFPGIQRPTGSKLAMVKFSEILAYYPTAEVYEQVKQKLN